MDLTILLSFSIFIITNIQILSFYRSKSFVNGGNFLQPINSTPSHGKDQGAANNPHGKVRLHIIIPCLHEQEDILETLEFFNTNFDDDWISITAVTTEHEGTLAGSTYDIINTKYSNQERVHLLHYPLASPSSMAHQINFCVDSLLENKTASSSDYVAIFNADSRPSLDFINFFNVADFHEAKIMQLSSLFTLNHSLATPKMSTGFALFQSRWTLVHEVPRFLNQFLKCGDYQYAHCVGHGLIVNIATFIELGELSTTTRTEDLHFGYVARCHGYKIHPIPSLANSKTPQAVLQNYLQRVNWFRGPASFISYYIQNKTKRYSIKQFSYIIQLALSTCSWLIAFPIIIILYILALNQAGTLAVAFLTYSLVSYYILMPILVVNYITPKGTILGTTATSKLILYHFVAHFLNTLSGWQSLVMLLGTNHPHKTSNN